MGRWEPHGHRRRRSYVPSPVVRAIIALAVLTSLTACSSGGRKATRPTNTTTTASATTSTTPTNPIVFAKSGGCGRVFFWAATAKEDVAVTATIDQWPQLPKQPAELRFELPSPVVRVELERGKDLTQPFCNDVVSTTRLDSRVAATSGSGVVHIDGVHGTLQLEDVRAGDLRLGPIKIATAQIGSVAG